MNVRVFDKKRVHNTKLRMDYYTFLLKEFIIRRLEEIYSTFLLKPFMILRLRVDYSTLLYEGFLIDDYW
jgi:hypothetical protein